MLKTSPSICLGKSNKKPTRKIPRNSEHISCQQMQLCHTDTVQGRHSINVFEFADKLQCVKREESQINFDVSNC